MTERPGGFVLLHRSLIGHPAFKTDGEAMFFAYLVSLAYWKPGRCRFDDRIYDLKRGELVISERKLAEAFDWGRQKVRGLTQRFEQDGMISKNSTQHGTQRAPIITICNYDKYQRQPGAATQDADQGQPKGNPRATQLEEKEVKEGKEGKEETTGSSSKRFVFAGKVIRLNERDFESWRQAYSAIDLCAALQELDDFYDGELTGAERGKWFARCSSALRNKHERARAERDGRPPGGASKLKMDEIFPEEIYAGLH